MARRSGDRAIPTFVPYVGIYQERLKGTNALLFVNPESMAIGGKPWKALRRCLQDVWRCASGGGDDVQPVVGEAHGIFHLPVDGPAFCSRPKKKIQPLCHPSAFGMRPPRFSLTAMDAPAGSSSVSTTRPSASPQVIQFSWRRDGDSNPGYAFGVYTISNRAPSASSDISPLRHRVPHHLTKQKLSSIQQP